MEWSEWEGGAAWGKAEELAGSLGQGQQTSLQSASLNEVQGLLRHSIPVCL